MAATDLSPLNPTPGVGPEPGMGYSSIASDTALPDTVSSLVKDGSGSSRRKRRRSLGESSARFTRASQDPIRAELVEIGRTRLDIMERMLQREMIERPVVYSIAQCLQKLLFCKGLLRAKCLQ